MVIVDFSRSYELSKNRGSLRDSRDSISLKGSGCWFGALEKELTGRIATNNVHHHVNNRKQIRLLENITIHPMIIDYSLVLYEFYLHNMKTKQCQQK